MGHEGGDPVSEPLTERDKEMLDPRVGPEIHKERIAPRKAIEDRVREADRRAGRGGAR
jgi:hypothetical protein